MKKCYLISYDLRAPGRNYDILYQAIKGYRTWARITESYWAIVTTQSASEIRNYLVQFMDSNDRLFVIKSGKEAAWRNARANSDWLKNHLNSI